MRSTVIWLISILGLTFWGCEEPISPDTTVDEPDTDEPDTTVVEDPDTTVDVLFTANFTNGWLDDGGEGYIHGWPIEGGEGIIFISDPDGNVLTDATWTGDASIEFELPLTPFPEKISVTTITTNYRGDSIITTHLDVPVGSSWTWKGINRPAGNDWFEVEFDFQNIPGHDRYSISSLWYTTSYASYNLVTPLTYYIYKDPVDVLVRLNTTESGIKYLWLDNVGGGNYQVDLSNLQPANTARLSPSDIEPIGFELRGYPIPGSHHTGDYYLASTTELVSPAEWILVPYPPSLFTDYKTHYSIDGGFYQTIFGEIPSSFTKIDADFDLVNSSPDDFQLETVGTFDQIRSSWIFFECYYDYFILWDVNGPADLTQYSLPTLPNSFFQNNHPYTQSNYGADKISLQLTEVEIIDHSELSSYEELLDVLSSSDYFDDVVSDSRGKSKSVEYTLDYLSCN